MAASSGAKKSAETPVDQLGYAEALAELEEILQGLEGGSVDVDRLTERVTRARALITRCRERIGDARVQIEQVVADLDD
ncbi:MAG: exodeoxyribonuclease small subunit [Actinomycetota bacterium]